MTEQEKPGSDKDTEEPNENQESKKSRMQRLDKRGTRRNVALGVAASTLGGLGAGVAGPSAPPPETVHKLATETHDAAVSFQAPTSWDIRQTKNEKVDYFIDFLMMGNHDKTKLWLERLGKYGPMIQQKLAERGMPQDLLWLAT